MHARHLLGQGRFIDDESADGALHMAILRSPVAHGRINGVTGGAGARLVLTAADLADLAPMVSRASVPGMVEPSRPVLATDKVVYVGQPVAAVVAETPEAALDALESLDLDIEPLDAVTQPGAATPEIWSEAAKNRAFRWSIGNDVEAAIASAAHVIEQTIEHPRIAISPVEPRGCLASWSPDGATLVTPSQGVVSLRRALAAILSEPEAHIRVVTHDVGGSFAAKIWPYPEHVLALIAARRLGAPVRWIGTRGEAFVGDAAGRARTDRARLALDAEGRFLAFAIDAIADMGAFLHTVAPSIVTSGAVRPFGQVYDIPAQHYAVEAVFTNAVPTDAYRGAGKPESTGTLERLIDIAAGRLGIDPFELRRKNLILPDRLPLDTPMGETIDAGDFPALAERIAQAADWGGLAARKADSAARGLSRGGALCFHMHASGGSTAERSDVRAMPDGTVRVRTGAQDSGQGHAQALARVAARALDLPEDRIRVEQGDSAWLEQGGGTGGSNLLPVAGNTVHRTALAMLERARAKAADLLEAAEGDITYGTGTFRIAGTDRTVELQAIAAAMEDADEPGCVAQLDFEGNHTTWPNGAFACEVEVDPQTGGVRIDRLTGVTDIGEVIDPESAEGQVLGGLVQGVGEAMMEGMVFDPDGQPLTGSFMDYRLPRADDVPAFSHDWSATESPNALIGAKGVGELASIGAPGVVVNAVLDALPGVEHLDMPLTAVKIWHALQR